MSELRETKQTNKQTNKSRIIQTLSSIDTPQHRDNDEANATVQTEIQGSSQSKLGTKVSESPSQTGKTKKDAAKMNERPSRGINRGHGSRIRSESLDCRAHNKEKANDIENTAAYTPRREQMNILEFLRKRKNTSTPPKENGKQPKLPNLRDSTETEPEGTGDCIQRRPIMNNVLHRTLVCLNIAIHFLDIHAYTDYQPWRCFIDLD